MDNGAFSSSKENVMQRGKAEEGEGDNQGDAGEGGFGEYGHDNEDVSNCDDDSDNDNRHEQEMPGLKTPVYTSPMANFGQKGVTLVGLVRNTM